MNYTILLLASAFILGSCIPVGRYPTPRMIRKNPQLIIEKKRTIFPDSVLAREHLLEFPYRNIQEIKLNWKMVAGLKLKSKELKNLRKLILSNVRNYWEFRFPNQEIISLELENMRVMDAEILIHAGYPLLLYSAYDLSHRGKKFSFEGYDICVGYRGIQKPHHKRVSFKLNSGLRGYLDSEKMLTGSFLDLPRLKHSKVQVLQVVLMIPPGKSLDFVHQMLRDKYGEMGIKDFTLPVSAVRDPIGSIR